MQDNYCNLFILVQLQVIYVAFHNIIKNLPDNKGFVKMK